jgi:hypothetical protein
MKLGLRTSIAITSFPSSKPTLAKVPKAPVSRQVLLVEADFTGKPMLNLGKGI